MFNRHSPLAMRASLGLAALLVLLPLLAFGDASTATISGGSATVTSSSSTTLNFPVVRSGDLSYDAFLQYQTLDGTAVAGTNYTAASGSVVIPAGTSSATIPVTILGSATNLPESAFQMLLLGGGGGVFTSSFGAQQDFGAESEPIAVAAADLNGDGKPDLIVVNFGGGTVSVLVNTAAPGATTPTFAAQQTFETEAIGRGAAGGVPVSVAVADVNGDGKPDLIIANRDDNDVSVLINTTTPGSSTVSFIPFQTFAVGFAPNSVTTADVNDDGKPDIIVANNLDNTVSVLLNTTTPGSTTASFAAQQTFATGNAPVAVTAADVNGDGQPDLIVANSADNTVSVLLNTTAPGATTPSFAAQQTFATGDEPFAVTAADVNGDGKPDLVVANIDDDTVSVLLNTTAPGAATPSFAAQQTFATGVFPYSVTAADVNDDGKLDLIVSNEAGDAMSVLLNTTAPGAATPSFAPQQTFATGTSPQAVTAVDVNGDGKPDLITANFDAATASVLLNTTAVGAATASFAAQQTFATGSKPFSVTAADVNGDGKPDLIIANSNNNTLSVLLNTSAPGAATPSFSAQRTFATSNEPFSVAAADVNGDGKPDLIVANESSDTVSVLLNTTVPGATTPSFATQQTFATGSDPYSVTAVDVNGDGKPDLIVANQTGATVSVLLNTTAPGAATPSFAPQQTFLTGSSPWWVTAVDVNGDGLPDLIVANEASNTVSVLLNTTAPGATTPSFAPQQTFLTGNSPEAVTAVDVNGDGLPDLIVANEASGTVSVLLNTTAPGATTPSFAPQQTFATGSSPDSVAALDVNGDGKPDLIVANQASNTVSVLLNTTAPGAATPSFATQQTFATGNSPYSVKAVNVNGDGLPDLIVANEANNTVSVLLNTLYKVVASGSPATGTIQYNVSPSPTPTIKPTPTLTPTPTITPTPTGGQILLNPTTVAFASTAIGTASTASLHVKNTGTGQLTGSVATPSAPFGISGSGAISLAPGQSATITLTFTPTTTTLVTSTVDVTSNSLRNSNAKLTLQGTGTGATPTISPTPTLTPTPTITPTPTTTPTPTGAQILLNPTTVVFASTAIGTTSTASLHVKNNGTAELTGSVPIPTAPFGISGSGAINLAPGKTATITLTFTPTTTTTVTSTVDVTSNSVRDSNTTLTLQGTGT
jgi:trimeric autotransporter adhesin